MTTTAFGGAASAAPNQELADGSPIGVAIDLIVAETGCSRVDALTGVRFIERMARNARQSDTWGIYNLRGHEIDCVGYSVMDDIMKHGSRSTPGSAHAAIEAFILERGEVALIHDNPTGRREDCFVTLQVRSSS
jgi:hypothetical protein